MPPEAPKAKCGGKPTHFASTGGGGAGIACGKRVHVQQNELKPSYPNQKEMVDGEMWDLQWRNETFRT